MSLFTSLQAIGVLFVIMMGLSLVEAVIPLHARGIWGRQHIIPNLMLTLVTFGTNLLYNIPLLLGLVWLQPAHLGLFNAVKVPAFIAIACSILVLDFAWYLTHLSMHKVAGMWRFHAVHHSDPQIDVTTTVRQHPVEGVIRYAYLMVFAFAVGAPPIAFAIYRVWSVVHGQLEHSNLKLPQWLDTAITFFFSSPNMHKIHHSRDRHLTDRNYTNIFSVWDRLFGTFVASKHGCDIVYGLEGFDAAERQTTMGLLLMPLANLVPPSRGE